MKTTALLALVFTLTFLSVGWSTNEPNADPLTGSYAFTGPVFDIEAMPDGSILVTEGDTIKEISRQGE